jgi:TetR/AcrR family transcriptional regulator, transcriptional repressor for nem operon
MPRRSQEDKARTHEQIVDIAAARIRQDGTTTPSVAEIMQAAGLTHGGFYKHFESRDELIAEAVDRAFAESQEATAEVIAHAEDPLAAFVDWYVSAEHRDNPASGCGVVSLGADATRADPRVRSAYTGQVERYLAQLEQLLGADADADADAEPETRRRAAVVLSTLVGAVLVSRAVDDPALSDEIITDVRAALVTTRAAG